MSFLKIKDPKKRDLIVEEFLKTKRNIQDNFLSDRLGDITTQRVVVVGFNVPPNIVASWLTLSNALERSIAHRLVVLPPEM